MNLSAKDLEDYNLIRSGGAGFIEMPRGFIAVWGKEAVQFLDGMITNDMKTLEDGRQMLAAFPNAQGRLLAVVRVLRQGERFFIETEESTRENVHQNLFRFTFAGDFFVEDLSDRYRFFELTTPVSLASQPVSPPEGESDLLDLRFDPVRSIASLTCLPEEAAETFRESLFAKGYVEISPELRETLRIEAGIPKYGVDMDENTIVPELGFDRMISYTKGCYIGQEIIARIHFRGHVAKQLSGLMSEPGAVATGLLPAVELTTADGKNAGRMTSVTYSPKLERTIALAFVRYDHLADGTELKAVDAKVRVTKLPFFN